MSSSPDPASATLEIARATLNMSRSGHTMNGNPAHRPLPGPTNPGKTAAQIALTIICQQISIENQLIETGHAILPALKASAILQRDRDGNLERVTCTLIDNPDGAVFHVRYRTPIIYDLVFSDLKRTRTDAVRLLTYFVSFGSQHVSSDSSIQSTLRDLVSLLNTLISTPGQAEPDQPRQYPHSSDHNSDPLQHEAILPHAGYAQAQILAEMLDGTNPISVEQVRTLITDLANMYGVIKEATK